MNNFKNELIYQWRMFRMQVIGGYEEVKRILNPQDLVEKFKEGIRVMEENDAYEAEQKRFHKQEILQQNDIVEFRDPDCYGNIIKAKVLKARYDYLLGEVEVKLDILEDALDNHENPMDMCQYIILNNLVKIEQPYINK